MKSLGSAEVEAFFNNAELGMIKISLSFPLFLTVVFDVFLQSASQKERVETSNSEPSSGSQGEGAHYFLRPARIVI